MQIILIIYHSLFYYTSILFELSNRIYLIIVFFMIKSHWLNTISWSPCLYGEWRPLDKKMVQRIPHRAHLYNFVWEKIAQILFVAFCFVLLQRVCMINKIKIHIVSEYKIYLYSIHGLYLFVYPPFIQDKVSLRLLKL